MGMPCVGSCRLPGNSQGLYSFRPTLGCYNFSDGLAPFQFTRDTVGKVLRLAMQQAANVHPVCGSLLRKLLQ